MLYSTGIVYKIVCTQDSGIVYIGSTFNLLRQRWQLHKSQYKRYLEGQNGCISIYPYFEKYGIENFKILKIKEYECCREHMRDAKHLEVYEQLWINKTKGCVNKKSPFSIPIVAKEQRKEYRKEWYENNKEYFAERSKQYYENNSDIIREKSKEYYEKNKDKIKEIMKGNQKEYYENNKEYFREYQKEYKQNNKEHLQEYYKEWMEKNKEKNEEKIECEICKASIVRGGLSRHKKTKKHIKNLEKNIV